MSESFKFEPDATTVFRFFPTLGGIQYAAACLWNIAGQRYYVAIYDGAGNVIINTPLVAGVNLLYGMIAGDLRFDRKTQAFYALL